VFVYDTPPLTVNQRDCIVNVQLDRPVEEVNRDTLLQSLPRHQYEGESMTAKIPEEVRIKQINAMPNIEFLSWVDGHKNNKSKAKVICAVDGFEWSASVHELVNGGSGCPICAGNRRFTEEERIEQINKTDNLEFVCWADSYKNSHSKAIVRCKIDGFEWGAKIYSIINNGKGCPQCGRKRRWTAEERIDQINSIENIEFVSWVDSYRRTKSKAKVRCVIDNFEWSVEVNSIVNCGRGCPKCAKYGFQLDKTGYLYALRSECGTMIKIGISNKPKQRHRQIELATPFKFNLIEQISGDGVKIAELEKYFHNKYESAGFSGFSGCTEWLVCTDELLKEIREMGR